MEEAELRTHHQRCGAEGEKLRRQLSAMEEQKKQLLCSQELHHWLEEYFLKLTYTLEKHILASTHSLFNQLFQEWFSIIIDYEALQARIDDSFYPVVKIGGYDVPYSMLSGGEKTSAALAYRLALNKVINDVVHTIKTKDLLIIDEPTDGFSSEQMDKVRDVLELLGLRQTIIVSHEQKME